MRRPEGSAGHPRKLSARLLRRLNLCRLLRFVRHRTNPAGGGDFAGVFGPDRLMDEVVDRLRCRDCGAASAQVDLIGAPGLRLVGVDQWGRRDARPGTGNPPLTSVGR